MPAATSAPEEPPPVVVSPVSEVSPVVSPPVDVSPVVSPPVVVSAVVVSAVVVSAVVPPEPSPAATSTVWAVVPCPTVISPEMVVLASSDSKQPVAPTATVARTRSSGRSRRARMPNSLPSRAAESVGDPSHPTIGGRIWLVDDLDAQLLDRIQTELPLVERPYAALAAAIGSDEDTVLERIAALREQKVIRQISAIFDSRRLGYRGMLVAARTPAERQDDAAAVFSTHPGVSHNYLREHELNLWFTLTVSPRSRLGLDRTVELLGELAEVDVIRPMPALRFFKIGVDLDVKGDRDPAAKLVKAKPAQAGAAPRGAERLATSTPSARCSAISPAEAEPFGELAGAGGLRDGRAARVRPRVPRDRPDPSLRRRARAPQRRLRAERHGRLARARGAPRRVRLRDGGVPRRLALLPAADLPGLAVQPLLDDARAHQGRLRGRARGDRRRDGPGRLLVLYSTKEYKKTRVSYFTPEESAWEQAHASLAAAGDDGSGGYRHVVCRRHDRGDGDSALDRAAELEAARLSRRCCP